MFQSSSKYFLSLIVSIGCQKPVCLKIASCPSLDKFSKGFYIKVQNAFIKLAKKDKRRYFVLDNSKDSSTVEKIILNISLSRLNK